MLYESDQLEPLLARFGADFARGFTLRKFSRIRPDGKGPARLLVDDLADPQVVIGLRGASVLAEGGLQALGGAFADLLAGRVECAGGWPLAELAEDWQRNAGRRYLFFVASSLASWRAARIAGFVNPPNEEGHDHEFVAYQWTWTGEPRHQALVHHPCRETAGEELLELIKQGVPYDPDGYYIRQCLANGPSFVCEVEGSPVAWSCTHLNGFMGMLYTPPELRRHGYARSLWAFQIDTMLQREGIAVCHVIDSNTPSLKLMHGLGGVPLLEPIVWRSVLWPVETAEPTQSKADCSEPGA